MGDFASVVTERLAVMIQAPLANSEMLWAAAPLVIATLFMTLYFGKYSREELGWNTAFGNTMVFLFVSISIIRFLYYSTGTGSWNSVFSNAFHSTVALGLAVVSGMLMLVTYYHLLPKKVAFFLFSAAPVNVSIYVLMAVIYAGVPADAETLVAGLIFFTVIFVALSSLQLLEHMAGKPDGISLESGERKEDRLIKKLKNRNAELNREKNKNQSA